MGKSLEKVFHVLVADNSPDDRLFLRRAVRLIDGFEIVAELSDPVEVIPYLNGDGPFGDRNKFPLPDLILLYLQKPLRNSFEVLKWIRESASYKMMIVVLTDSMEINHIKRALDLGADLFEVKPHGNAERVAMLMALEDYLLESSVMAHRHLTISPAA
jgi:DNA-binding NarL/FixJ family response regulator